VLRAVELGVNEDTRKSLIRHIRRLAAQWLPAVETEAFQMGKLAAKLIPHWVETEHKSFDDYLHHEYGIPTGLAMKLEMMAMAYFEVPSIEIWKHLGFNTVYRAARKNREEMLDRLLNCGANPLDVLSID
jgi:hypothetical protein